METRPLNPHANSRKHSYETQFLNSAISMTRDVWRKLIPPTVRLQRHFAVTAESLALLQHNSLTATSDNYTVRFYDTHDALLLRNNWWLLYQQHRWELRICQSCEFDSVIFEEFLNFQTIIEKLCELPGIVVSNNEGLRSSFSKFAKFKVARLNFNCTNFMLYLDCAQFAEDDCYVVGTLSAMDNDGLGEELTSHLDGLEVIGPVRSKVCEHLYLYRTDLYQKMIAAKFIPDVPFVSSEINHYSSAPLRKPDWKDSRRTAQQKYLEANRPAIEAMRRKNEAYFSTPEGQLLAEYLEY